MQNTNNNSAANANANVNNIVAILVYKHKNAANNFGVPYRSTDDLLADLRSELIDGIYPPEQLELYLSCDNTRNDTVMRKAQQITSACTGGKSLFIRVAAPELLLERA